MRNLLTLLFCTLAFSGIYAQNFRYAHSIGLGTATDEDISVVTDNDGNVYEVGSCMDIADLDPGPGTFYIYPSSGGMATYLMKKDSAGNFIWGRQLPRLFISSLNYNQLGRLVIAGQYNNQGLDIDPGPLTTYLDSFPCGGVFSTFECGADFIAEFDTSGNLEWARSLISHHNIHLPEIHDIETDAAGNVYVVGYFYDSLDVDPGPGTFWLASGDVFETSMFLTKLDFAGNFLWAEQFMGSGQERAHAIRITGSGDLLMAGYFQQVVDFDPGPGTVLKGTPTDDGNMYVLKLTADGDFISVKDFVNSGEQYISDMELDPEGNIYLTGLAQDSVDFDPGTGTYSLAPYCSGTMDYDIFVMKLDFNQNFQWAKRFGPSSYATHPELDLDLVGNVYTAGLVYDSVDIDPGPGVYSSVPSVAGIETFIQKLNTDGSFNWARVLNLSSTPRNICLDHFYNIYLSGMYNGTIDFDPNASMHFMTGQSDGYLLKLSQRMGNVTTAPELQHQSLSQVYPNPTTGNITVFTGEQIAQAIVVTDVSGRTVYTAKPISTQTTIDLAGLSSGAYFVVTRMNNSVLTTQLVKIDH